MSWLTSSALSVISFFPKFASAQAASASLFPLLRFQLNASAGCSSVMSRPFRYTRALALTCCTSWFSSFPSSNTILSRVPLSASYPSFASNPSAFFGVLMVIRLS